MVKVVATQKGYFGSKVREIGEEFSVAEDMVSARWMKPVDPDWKPGTSVLPEPECEMQHGTGTVSGMGAAAVKKTARRTPAESRAEGKPASRTGSRRKADPKPAH